ncbi:MAG: hypothetical protein K5644_03475 [Lachnospiraceae bacterium]|nr:hypothetical protein [Lachnospiraceae bacterium]
MRYLVMSCSTGGGHNSAAHAVEEELISRGHDVDFLDPYDLIHKKLSSTVGGAYIKLVQKFPTIFGTVYFAGDIVSRIPVMSPVYFANAGVANKMRLYLQQNQYDGIIMSHLYPAEMITMLKHHKVQLPPTFYIATDYTCIPFTAETECDYYCLPGEGSVDDFVSRGIPREKIKPYGIPVKKDFNMRKKNKSSELSAPWLNPNMRHILVVGGSIGAGSVELAVKIVSGYIREFNKKVDDKIIESRKLHAIVVCGNNKKLYKKLYHKKARYVTVLQATDNMSEYMKASDIVISKPGGLSSTEVAVAKVPLIHISPIPGCEIFNVKYFEARGMSIYVKNLRKDLASAITALLKPANRRKMLESQEAGINENARDEWCDFIEDKTKSNTAD